MPFTLHGLAVSQGIAIGHVHLVSHALLEVNHYHVAPRYLDEELARLDEALATVQGELIGLKAITTSGQAHSEVGAFVDLQLMMLADPMLVDAARQLVDVERAAAAVQHRHAVQQEARGERAEHEVLHRRLGGPRVVAPQRHQRRGAMHVRDQVDDRQRRFRMRPDVPRHDADPIPQSGRSRAVHRP